MMKQDKDTFTWPMFKRLWIPAMVSSLGWALSDMADAIVVGHSLGTTGLAAISLILPVYMIHCMFAHGLGLGGSVKFSKLLGEGKASEAERNFNTIMTLAVLFSIVIALFGNIFMKPLLAVLGTTPKDGSLFGATKDYLRVLMSATPFFYVSNILNYYLRNDENQKIAVIGSMVGNICDIGLNIIFVLVLNMGTRGAALSTLIGQIISILIYLPGVTSKAHAIKWRIEMAYLKEGIQCLVAGLATSIQYLYQLIFFLMMNRILMKISGEAGVAIFDLLQNTSYLILYIFEGTARGMQPILSTYQGEHNEQGKHKILKLGLTSGMTVGGLLIILIIVLPQCMCLLFGIEGAWIEQIAYEALRIYCIGAGFAGINILLCQYYQSCEVEKAAFTIETLRGICLLLPCTFLFSWGGMHTIWWLFPATEVGTLLVFILFRKTGRICIPSFDSNRVFQFRIDDNQEEIAMMHTKIEAFCKKWHAQPKEQYAVMMAVEEIYLAIHLKGFVGKAGENIHMILVAQTDGSFDLHVRYNAKTFNPFSLETVLIDYSNAFDMDAMGMMLIKKTAKAFYYRHYQGFNTLVVKL